MWELVPIRRVNVGHRKVDGSSGRSYTLNGIDGLIEEPFRRLLRYTRSRLNR